MSNEAYLENNYNDLLKDFKKQSKKIKILRTVKCGQFSPRVDRICVDFKVL